jgi:hypothetical protein
MPRSYQAYPQNAVVTHSPATVNGGDPSQAIQAASGVFTYPSMLDICSGVTNGTSNPFMAGLNTMGDGSNTSGVAGQTGNMLSGLQLFTDSLCGFATGSGTTVSEVLAAARNLRAQGGDLHETLEAVRKLRDTVGYGTTPQSVLAGVEGVTNLVNSNPVAQGAIQTGQQAVGISGNQIVDSINGAQVMTGQGNQLLTGVNDPTVSGNDLLTAAGNTINQNTANLISTQSLTSAQSVSLQNQNLLVSQDFATAYTVAGDTDWTWDGTDNAPGSSAPGCAKVTCNGLQNPLVSSEIPVTVGETIEVSCFVKWSGLTYTGASPIVLAVEKYRLMKAPDGSGQDTYSDVGWYDIYTVPSPGSASSSTANNWVGIAGTYTVEPGVDQLRFRLCVVQNATAGWVKWDAAEFLKLDLIAAECVPGITDNIVTQLYGTQGSGFTENQAAVALFNTAQSLASVTSQVAALQAEGMTGAIAGDDFSWTGEIATNANWAGGYTTNSSVNTYGNPCLPAFTTTSCGNYAADQNNADWQQAAGFDQYCYFAWQGTDAASTTDYQLIQTVLASAPVANPNNPNIGSYLRLYGRIASGWASYVVASIGSDGTYSIQYYAGGSVLYPITSGVCAVPGLASTVSFYLGDKASTTTRHYRIEVGTTVICDVTEAGSGSNLGTTYRGWGWGARNQGDGSLLSGTPPSINQWLAMDQ